MTQESKGISSLETLAHLLKGNIGPGILGMPLAFMYSGLYVGLIGTTILGFIALHCSQLLLQASATLRVSHGFKSLSYEETAIVALEYSHMRSLRKYAPAMGVFVRSFLCITQLGICCIFFVFPSDNIYQVLACAIDPEFLSTFEIMLILLLPIILMTYISDLKKIAPFSMIAGAVMIAGFIITFYYLMRDLGSGEVLDLPFFAGMSTMPNFFSNSMFAFMGIGLVLPLENGMETPGQFYGWLGVLNTGFTMVIIMFDIVGYFGYLRFGNVVQGSITLNLPGNEILAQLVKIAMAIAVLLTYPIQFYIPRDIMEPWVLAKMEQRAGSPLAPSRTRLVQYTFRTALVVMTFGFAAAVPNIGLFIGLIGSFVSTALAIIFPPIIHLLAMKENVSTYLKVKAAILILVGGVGFCTGSYTSVVAIVDFFKAGSPSTAANC